MSGRICLVTGATAGIGLVTARELARRGPTVVIVGRNRHRCEAAVSAIRDATSNNAVSFLQADLSSQADVRRLAHDFQQRHNRLHVLINNAGALFALRQQSVDNIEMTLALNHLAPFLLTNLLLDTIVASAPARIINVSSDSHEMVKSFNFNDPLAKNRATYGQSELASLFFTLLAPRAHPGLNQYAQSKLANLLFTTELARRLANTGITVNALHPGFVATSFTAGNGTYGWFMRLWGRIFGATPDEGAKTTIYLATSPALQHTTGRYFVKQKPIPPSPAAQDTAAAQQLWELSEQLTSRARQQPEVA